MAKETKRRLTFTPQDKDRLVEFVEAVRKKEGVTIPQACEKALKEVEPFKNIRGYTLGSITTLYTWWRNKREGKSYVQTRKERRLQEASDNAVAELDTIRAVVANGELSTEERKLVLQILAGIVGTKRAQPRD